MQLIPLGINGYFPSFGRQTASFLVLTTGRAVVLDAGTGIAHLRRPDLQDRLQPYDALDILLSHYHLDHLTGLFYLPEVWNRGPVRIFAPAPPFVSADPVEALNRIFSPPFVGSRERFSDRHQIVPLDRDVLDIDGLAFNLWPQKHPGGSIGFRLDNRLAYSTDKSMDQTQQDRVRGVKLLLHELWLTDEEAARAPEELAIHCHLRAVAEFARGAQVGALMPIHHHPARTEAEILDLCRKLEQAAGLPVWPPVEGKVYEIS